MKEYDEVTGCYQIRLIIGGVPFESYFATEETRDQAYNHLKKLGFLLEISE